MADEAQLGAAVAGVEETDGDTEDIAAATLASTLSITQSRSIRGNNGSGNSTSNSVDDDAEDHFAAGQTPQSVGSRDNDSRSDSFASGGPASNFSIEELAGSGFPTDVDNVVEVGDGSLGAGPQAVGSYVAIKEELEGDVRDRRSGRPGLSKGLGTGNAQEKAGSRTTTYDIGTPPRIEIPRNSRGPSPASSRNSSLPGSTSRRTTMGASPGSSRNSSLSDGTPPCKASRSVALSEGGNAGGRTLDERLEAALGERTGPDEGDRRSLVSASSGANLRAVLHRDDTRSPPSARRRGTGDSMPTSGARGIASGPRAVRSTGTSPQSSRSPDTRRSSISFVEYVANSHSELSLTDSSRQSIGGGKRPRNRNALRVAVRVRPMIAREKGSRTVACEGGDGRLVVVNPKKFKASPDAVLATASAVSRANMTTSDWLRPFDFDRVFWSHGEGPKSAGGSEGGGVEARGEYFVATQCTVYEGLGERIVEDAINGIHCSCFAYGHTGSGKTYSMFGFGDRAISLDNQVELAGAPEGEGFGLVPRVCYHLLRRLKEVAPTEPETSGVNLSVQFVEIYNDKIRDLLHPGADSSAFRVREHPKTGPYVDNLVPVEVESWSQLRQILVLGCAARTERDTPENSKSSRGHAILTLEAQTAAGLSRVQMVDLAGSERESTAKIRKEIDGGDARSRGGRRDSSEGDNGDGRTLSQRLRETAQIKKALSNLGIIIKGLSRGDRAVGLPFRDSILTWLLKEALSGRAHTTMLATVSPSSDSYVETMNTLKYAERLRKASAHLYWNRDMAGGKVTKPPEGIRKEMETLVQQLGADGIEAKRQVLYQTVADPQQRIAKLTMKDPRRARRFSDSGLPLPSGRRFAIDDAEDEPRRTTFPGTPSPNRFGWNASSPSARAETESSQAGTADGGGETWGSPIVSPDDLSVESPIPGEDEVPVDEDQLRPLGGSPVSFSTQTKVDTRDSGDGGCPGGELSEPAGAGEELVNRPENADGSQVREDYGDEEEDSVQLYSESESEVNAEHGERGEDIVTQPAAAYQADASDNDPLAASGLGVSEEEDSVDELGGQISSDSPVSITFNASNDEQRGPNSESQEQAWPNSSQSGVGLSGTGTSLLDDRRDNESLSPGISLTGDTGVGTDPSFSVPTPPVLDSAVQIDRASTPALADVHRERADETGANPTMARVGGAVATGRPGNSASSNGSSRHVSWEQEHEDEEPADGRGSGIASPTVQTSSAMQGTIAERGDGGGGFSAHDFTSVGQDGDGGIEPVRQHPTRTAHKNDGDRPLSTESYLHSSGEYVIGGGAAALAASGVFDMSGTSGEAGGEETEEGVSVGDLDSLDGDAHGAGGLRQEPIASQEPQLEIEATSRWPLKRDAGIQALRENTRGLVEDLMRQVQQLRDEVSRLKAELQTRKDSQEQARAARTEADHLSEELKLRLSSAQRSLENESDRARDAEIAARDATIRADNIAIDARNAAALVEDAQTRAREAEQRALEAGAAVRDLSACATEDGDRLSAFRDALEEQIRRTQEANQRAEQSEEALEVAGGNMDAALNAAQQAADEERTRAEEAETRAERARARLQQLDALVDEHEQRLTRTRNALEEAGARADAAEERERQAVAIAEELTVQMSERDQRLAKAREAIAGAVARAETAVTQANEAAAARREAEDQAKELARMLERQREEVEEAKRERQRSLAEVRAAAEAEMERSAARRDGILEERDRALEQVEAERTEVLRLTTELSNLRSAARQDMKAAQDRETALKALLASETEVSRSEQADVEELLSLISSAQDTEGGGSTNGVGGQVPVSVAGARFAIETERREHEAARRRLRALEEENRALRREQDNARQVPSERTRAAARQHRLTREQETQTGAMYLRRENQTQTASRESGVGASTDCVEPEPELRDWGERQGRKEQDLEMAPATERLAEEETNLEFERLRERLEKEEELRAEQFKQFEERLKEVRKEGEQKTSNSIRKVLEGVKTQAKHIKDTVARLETERDEARSAESAANEALEGVKCQMESLKEEQEKTQKEFEDQMKHNTRERAALWLAVNKLDVLEAAKDSIIKDLQADGAMKKRDLQSLQLDNDRLSRELGQIDISLMQALEDNGLTLDNVKLQNSVMSRRLGRRSIRVQRNSTKNSHAAGTSPDSTGPPIQNAGPMVPPQGHASSRTRLAMRPGASRSAFGRDERALAWAVSGGVAGDRRDPPSRTRGRIPRQLPDSSGPGLEQARRARPGGGGGGRDLGSGANSDGDMQVGHEVPPSSRRMYNETSASSVPADGWDPAIHTIEREIEQLSDRLNGQGQESKLTNKLTPRVHDNRRASSNQDSRDKDARGHSNTGKRSRVRSSEVSPARIPDTQRPRRDGGAPP